MARRVKTETIATCAKMEVTSSAVTTAQDHSMLKSAFRDIVRRTISSYPNQLMMTMLTGIVPNASLSLTKGWLNWKIRMKRLMLESKQLKIEKRSWMMRARKRRTSSKENEKRSVSRRRSRKTNWYMPGNQNKRSFRGPEKRKNLKSKLKKPIVRGNESLKSSRERIDSQKKKESDMRN
jgi:hypothetical protein